MMIKSRWPLLLAFAIGLPAQGFAQGSVPGEADPVSRYRPATALLDGATVAWTANTPRGARVLAGAIEGSPAELGPAGDGDDGAPAIVAAGAEMVVVAARWNAGRAHLWAQAGNGAQWMPAQRLPNVGISDHHPVAAADEHGDQVWFAWVAEDADGLWAIAVAPWNGRRLGAIERVPNTLGHPGPPTISVDRNGRPVIAWSAVENGDSEIWVARRTPAGWSAPRRVTTNDVPDETPTLGRREDGRLILAWTSFTPTGYHPWAATERPRGGFAGGTELDTQAAGAPVVLGGPDATVAWSAIYGHGYELRMTGTAGDRWLAPASAGALASPQLHATRSGRQIVVATTGAELRRATGYLRPNGPDRHGGAELGLPELRERRAATDALPELPGRYRAFGDSVTEGVIITEAGLVVTDGYPVPLESFIGDFLGKKHIDMVNDGLGGESTTAGLGRLAGLAIADPRLFTLILEGINDASALVPPETVATNLRAMVRVAKIGGRIALISNVIPRTTAKFVGNDNVLIRSYNGLIETMAKEEGALHVDMYSTFFRKAGQYSDPLHPNELGYQKMAETWFRALLPLFTAILNDEDMVDDVERDGARILDRHGLPRLQRIH